jgi:FHS family L-fucose permease-like MFS transporter
MHTATSTSIQKKQGLSPVVIIGILFFIFGFITWLNSVLIPYLKLACELNNAEAYLVTTAFYISYFVLAIPSGRILKKNRLQKRHARGLAVMAVGALIFIPAALSRFYGLFLFGLFVQGSGLALLQTAFKTPTSPFWARPRVPRSVSASWAYAIKWRARLPRLYWAR